MRMMPAFHRIATLCIACLLLAANARAADGYKIRLKFTDLKDTTVYLAFYYGKSLPNIYRMDSARLDKNGVAVFNRSKKIVGGIHLLVAADQQTHFELLLKNGDDMSITVSKAQLPAGVEYKNAPENERFQQYVEYLSGHAAEQDSLEKQYTRAKTAADSATARKALIESSNNLTTYRRTYVRNYPGTLLAKVFDALDLPEVPEGPHLLPSGAVDSEFAYNYFKAHYWDKFDFNDDRLVYTPIYDARLAEYFNRLVLPYPDSVEHEADLLLAKTRGKPELFKYTLHWLTRYSENSKIMGMDEVYVYIIENYLMKGDATWIDSATLVKYEDRARKIAPNVIGNKAPEIVMLDIDKRVHRLSDVQAKYTVVLFFSADCGTCLRELPKLDSIYQAALKAKGVKIFAVRTEGDEAKWQELIGKNHMGDWINVYDPGHSSDYKAKYDVYGVPVIYLLDENKIIRGKRLDHSNILSVINMLEERTKAGD